jgi:thymidylate kinase
VRIVVEGLDFAGKSTVCRHLAALLQGDGWRVRRSTTSLAGGLMPPLIEAAYRSPYLPDVARSMVYHLAYLPDLLLPTRTAPDVAVLQESYVCRVWAYDMARRRPRLEAAARRLAGPLHRRVDLAVLLHAPYEIRRARYLDTGVRNFRDEARFAPAARKGQQFLAQALERVATGCGYRLIDTGGQSAQDAAEEVAVLARSTAARR